MLGMAVVAGVQAQAPVGVEVSAGPVAGLVKEGTYQVIPYAGNATFPVEFNPVTLPEGQRVTRTPVAEIALLRGNGQKWKNKTVTTSPATNPLAGLDNGSGPLQPEAIGLYASSGYIEIPRFGLYRCDPGCRCFGKLLPVAVQPAR